MCTAAFRLKWLTLLFLLSSLSADSFMLPPQVIIGRDLVEQIQPSDNSYRQRRRVMRWQHPDGSGKYVCHSDCVGFIDSLLMHSYGLNRFQFWHMINRERPTARYMEQAIAAGRGFDTITTIQDARPGDIIAVAFPLGLKANGHVMMIDDYPKRRESTPAIIDDTIQWAVRIIDCTGVGHGTDDTRYIGRENGRAQFNSGAGIGTIRIYTDSQGHEVAYSWSLSPDSVVRKSTTHPLAIGRFSM